MSSLLAADKEVAPCRELQGGHVYGAGCERAWGDGSASGVDGEGPTQGLGGQGTRGAHPEHAVHIRDAGGIPIGDVRVEILQVVEEVGLGSTKPRYSV